MKNNSKSVWLISVFAIVVLLSSLNGAFAQERQAFSRDDVEKAKAEEKNNPSKGPGPQAAAEAGRQLGCTGPISRVSDVAFEGLKFTSANFFTNPGGGEGGGFDKTPVLTTTVPLAKGTCLDAHLSAIVGGRQAYGVAAVTLFQVTLTFLPPTTPPLAGPRHMVGHFERPYGSNSPAVALEAERDVDMYASNFFQKVGTGPHEVRPGTYRVDVWWAGNGPGGAIAADFVLKLYLR